MCRWGFDRLDKPLSSRLQKGERPVELSWGNGSPEGQEPGARNLTLWISAGFPDQPRRERRRLVACDRAVEQCQSLCGDDGLNPLTAAPHDFRTIQGGEHRVAEPP